MNSRRDFLKVMAATAVTTAFGFYKKVFANYGNLEREIENYKELLLSYKGNRVTLQDTFSRITQYDDYILRAIERGLDDVLIKAVIATESCGHTRKRSEAGAVGLMQLMPDTAKELGIKINKFVDHRMYPEDSVIKGSDYLVEQIKRFGVVLGLAAYNYGPTIVEKLVKEFKGDLDKVFLALPGETQKHIIKILSINRILEDGNIGIENMLLFSKRIERCGIHVVGKGESLETVANGYGIKIVDIKYVNPEIISYKKLCKGLELRIPLV